MTIPFSEGEDIDASILVKKNTDAILKNLTIDNLIVKNIVEVNGNISANLFIGDGSFNNLSNDSEDSGETDGSFNSINVTNNITANKFIGDGSFNNINAGDASFNSIHVNNNITANKFIGDGSFNQINVNSIIFDNSKCLIEHIRPQTYGDLDLSLEPDGYDKMLIYDPSGEIKYTYLPILYNVKMNDLSVNTLTVNELSANNINAVDASFDNINVTNNLTAGDSSLNNLDVSGVLKVTGDAYVNTMVHTPYIVNTGGVSIFKPSGSTFLNFNEGSITALDMITSAEKDITLSKNVIVTGNLDVSGNIDLSNNITATKFIGDGSFNNINAGDASFNSINVTNNITANKFIGDASINTLNATSATFTSATGTFNGTFNGNYNGLGSSDNVSFNSLDVTTKIEADNIQTNHSSIYKYSDPSSGTLNFEAGIIPDGFGYSYAPICQIKSEVQDTSGGQLQFSTRSATDGSFNNTLIVRSDKRVEIGKVTGGGRLNIYGPIEFETGGTYSYWSPYMMRGLRYFNYGTGSQATSEYKVQMGGTSAGGGARDILQIAHHSTGEDGGSFYFQTGRGILKTTMIMRHDHNVDICNGNLTVQRVDQTIPYHLELRRSIADVWSRNHQTWYDISIWSVYASSSSTYNSDATNTVWTCRYTGVYQFNLTVMFRSVNADYLVESIITLRKDSGGTGSYTTITQDAERRWGSSVNASASDRHFHDTRNISFITQATAGDKFKTAMFGRAYYGHAIWIMNSAANTSWTITKIG